nr:NTP transferase domain-containing protein [Paracoccus aestuariivivens]
MAVVVLAAGQSRRFGSQDKLMAAFEGRPLAAHIVRTLQGLPRCRGFVVLRDSRHSGLFRGLRPVLIGHVRSSQSRSLAAGIKAARNSGASHVLLLLADMPRLARCDLVEVVRGCLTHPAMAKGKRPMPPALLPRALFYRLGHLTGDNGAAALLRNRNDLILRRISASRLCDVDRVADLLEMRCEGRAEETKPVLTLTIDGGSFDGIDGFYEEINRVFMANEDWRLGHSLDALDDMLYGGYGALNGAMSVGIHWKNIGKSRQDLGVGTTRNWLLGKLAQPVGYNTRHIQAQLDAVERGEGETFFEIVLQIFAAHPNINLTHDDPLRS